MEFKKGDVVTWSSQAAGSWKTKTGVITEVWEYKKQTRYTVKVDPKEGSTAKPKFYYATNNIRQLAPAIMSVLPLEYRNRLAPQNDMMSLIASAMKECAEAKQAVLLDAPEHQKLKEVSEGIASLFRLMPEQVGPLMTMVTSMLGVM